MTWAGFVQSTLCRSTEIEEKVSGWCEEAYESVAFLLPVGGGEGGFWGGKSCSRTEEVLLVEIT